MAYSIVGILAIAVHLIVNIDVILNIRGEKKFSGEKHYLFFLVSVIIYHITDAFWGFLYDAHLSAALFADTTVYFITMATSILLWGIFVYRYLSSNNKMMIIVSAAIFAVQVVFITINFFTPILFKVTEACEYSALPARYAMLILQIAMFVILAAYTLYRATKNNGSLKRRHLTVSLFSVFMIISITLQVFFPLLPMYSAGYLFGICALHSFVVQDERANQRMELEQAQYRVSIDPLSGAMSKYAYVDLENEIDGAINTGQMEPFAIVVFDLNDLKVVNDTEGHEVGDEFIVASVKLIKEHFDNYPVYRVGGDEFAVILTKDGFDKKDDLLESFNRQIDENAKNKDKLVISAGLATFIPGQDTTIMHTFTRADRLMYVRKNQLKEGNKK